MKMRIYRRWQWNEVVSDGIPAGALPQYGLQYSDEVQRELPDGQWETIGSDLPLVDNDAPPHPLEIARPMQAAVYQREHFNYIVGMGLQNDDGSPVYFGDKKVEKSSGGASSVIASWSQNDDGIYISVCLKNDHLTVMLANPFHKPMTKRRISMYLLDIFEVICPGERMGQDLSLFPSDYFEPLIDGCRYLFPQFVHRAGFDYHYKYVIDALSTGNLTVVLRDRLDVPEFTLPSFRLDGRPEGQYRAIWPVDALPELVAEADRYYQTKVAGNNKVNPTRTINGVFEEMERQCAR